MNVFMVLLSSLLFDGSISTNSIGRLTSAGPQAMVGLRTKAVGLDTLREYADALVSSRPNGLVGGENRGFICGERGRIGWPRLRLSSWKDNSRCVWSRASMDLFLCSHCARR